jgi:hypothetical protein
MKCDVVEFPIFHRVDTPAPSYRKVADQAACRYSGQQPNGRQGQGSRNGAETTLPVSLSLNSVYTLRMRLSLPIRSMMAQRSSRRRNAYCTQTLNPQLWPAENPATFSPPNSLRRWVQATERRSGRRAWSRPA